MSDVCRTPPAFFQNSVQAVALPKLIQVSGTTIVGRRDGGVAGRVSSESLKGPSSFPRPPFLTAQPAATLATPSDL